MVILKILCEGRGGGVKLLTRITFSIEQDLLRPVSRITERNFGVVVVVLIKLLIVIY